MSIAATVIPVWSVSVALFILVVTAAITGKLLKF
jgi:hypothetical protein